MNRLFSLIRERARGKMADDSDSAAENLTIDSTAGKAVIVEEVAVNELASEEVVIAEKMTEQSRVVEQGKVQSTIETIAPIEDEQSEEPLYGIVIHNDDKTTFEYVIHILTYYFLLSREMAEHIADVTHREGSSLALLRPYEEAQYLIKIAHMKAELDGYPLRFSLEAPDEELAVCRNEPEREI